MKLNSENYFKKNWGCMQAFNYIKTNLDLHGMF